MKRASLVLSLAIVAGTCFGTRSAPAQDWPQWRGPNRDGKSAELDAPTTWPKELTQKWKVEVGDGCATPALVADKLYVFARQGSEEVLRCLEAETGKEVWRAGYEAQGSTDPGGFVGPRSSPAVADGKVVTQGARGMLSCFDAATGKELWSKDEFRDWPRFFASSSPLIADGMCIAQVGGGDGAVVAYDLVTGEEKWKEAGLPTSYASPVLMNVDGTKLVVAQVEDGIVAIDIASGKKVWEKFFDRGGSRYKAATPIIDGNTLIYCDGQPRALQLTKEGDQYVEKELWDNPQQRVEYNTPVLKGELLIGLTGNSHEFFCFHIPSGKTAWTAAAPRMEGGPGARGTGGGPGKAVNRGQGPGGAKGKGFGGRGFGGGMRADAGYGSIVDAGPVLIALTPSSDLIVFQPSDKEFKQVASYKVANGGTYAYPVVSGNRVFIKDRDSVRLWTIE